MGRIQKFDGSDATDSAGSIDNTVFAIDVLGGESEEGLTDDALNAARYSAPVRPARRKKSKKKMSRR